MDILSGGESDDDNKFAINNDYAKNYNKWRPAEHLQRLKDKYGNNPEDDEEDSDESSEDEDAQDLTPEVERDFFKTLSSLKKKDPKIYDGKTEFFKMGEKKEVKEKKEKPVRIGDIERQVMVEKGGKFDDLEDEKLAGDCEGGKTYVEEMDDIKKGFEILNEEESDEEEELLVKRTKTKEEKKAEDEEYKAWLNGQKEELEDENVVGEMGGLREYWNSDKLDKDEKFLKDYILNKRYIEEDNEDYVPTYDEVVHDSDEGLSEDEENVKKMEEFEVKFNFRSEEPDEEFIKRYPRTFKDSMRKKDDRRKIKRKEVEERKEKEKDKKKEELKLLKALKRDEILEKLDKLRKITGNEDMDFKDEDIEADFDPEEYDKRMKKVFEDYDANADDEEKPTFSDLEDDDFDEDYEAEDWDNWAGPKTDEDYEPNCEDDDFNMDCDYDENAKNQKEIVESTKGRKKSRRKSKFAEAIETTQDKPVFNPDDKTFEEYVDEYYKLDCEDVIGDLPCRFKYRKVEANDFGLSCDEILNAKDPELNAWVSLRKSCQYRSEAEEKHDVHVFRNKGKNVNLKKKVMPSLFETEEEKKEEGGEGEAKVNKKKRKKKKKKGNANTNSEIPGGSKEGVNETGDKKRKLDGDENDNESQSVKKVKVDETASQNANVGEGKKKKKKKKGQNQQQQGGGGSSISLQGVASFYNKSNGAHKKNSKNSFKNNKKSGHEAEAFSVDRLKAYGINPRKFKKEKFRKMEEEKKKQSAAK